jgi:hypothetical protein
MKYKERFAPRIVRRFVEQRRMLRKIRKEGENNYNFVLGDYGVNSYFHHGILFEMHEGIAEEQYQQRPIEMLSGFEVYMQSLIDKFLDLKKGKEPVILLDIGSVAGLTWHRLANHYKEKVHEGKIAFVASSLSYTPNQEIPASRIFPVKPAEKEFLQETADLVHHVVGTVSQLAKQQIVLPDRRKISLQGNVDVVYESQSMTAWSTIPDIDIVKIPRLLSEYGLYFVTKMDQAEVQGDQFWKERAQAIDLAHNLLNNRYNLEKVEKVQEGRRRGEELNYDIFKRENAPRIRVDGVYC